MQATAVPSEIQSRAMELAPWAVVIFWVGAAGVAVTVAAASIAAVGVQTDTPAVLAALHAVLVELLRLSPAIALLHGLWETSRYLRAVAGGAAVEPATLAVLRHVGDACVWAGVLAMLVAPNVMAWLRGGGFDLRIEPEFVALTGLGVLLGLIGRVLALSAARAEAARAELDQIV